MLTKKNHKNITAWQINSQEKLFIEMDKNLDGVLKIILDMHIIYTKYLNQAYNANKQYNQIWIIALALEQKLQISNDERIEVITLLKVQVAKSN